MLEQIPTHVIAGPLGAGKTSLLRQLLAQKPGEERWALLINEFGAIGLDAALLETGADGVAMAEVAGGCVCCVSGVPFQVGLARLLRRSRPQRLFIEPSGLGHPAELLRQLAAAPWRGVLHLQPLVLVLDAAALAAGAALPDSQASVLGRAGLLVLNKAENLSSTQRAALAERWPTTPLLWTQHGQITLADLPTTPLSGVAISALPETTPLPGGALWRDPAQPLCEIREAEEGWSIGWRWHPSQRFDLPTLCARLQALGWRRAKLVMHGAQDWLAANALEGAALTLTPSAWRRDSRLELIFDRPQDSQRLNAVLADCRFTE
ncbi:MAG TPA: GTP-binding protein [Pseudomonas sp.]|jgi:Ni2+-binding GTPase involved in maturation of urease and hydrogenase|nr:GTP-binding protein [Pseudomonas sp.]